MTNSQRVADEMNKTVILIISLYITQYKMEFVFKNCPKCEREVLKMDHTFLIMQFSYNGAFRITYA